MNNYTLNQKNKYIQAFFWGGISFFGDFFVFFFGCVCVCVAYVQKTAMFFFVGFETRRTRR